MICCWRISRSWYWVGSDDPSSACTDDTCNHLARDDHFVLSTAMIERMAPYLRAPCQCIPFADLQLDSLFLLLWREGMQQMLPSPSLCE